MRKPLYKDCCEHGLECFVGSIEVPQKVDGVWQYNNYDVYLFPHEYYGTEVYIRYGNEDSEYISPGGLLGFAKMATANPIYDEAFILINSCISVSVSRR
jgi:hypothetical protein